MDKEPPGLRDWFGTPSYEAGWKKFKLLFPWEIIPMVWSDHTRNGHSSARVMRVLNMLFAAYLGRHLRGIFTFVSRPFWNVTDLCLFWKKNIWKFEQRTQTTSRCLQGTFSSMMLFLSKLGLLQRKVCLKKYLRTFIHCPSDGGRAKH
jgi:hypothetical protein